MNINSDKYRDNLPLILLLATAFVIFAFRMTSLQLWGDEAVEFFFSINEAHRLPGYGFPSFFENIVNTYQPPLYNLLMYPWLKVSTSLFWFRIFSVLMTLGAGAAIYRCGMTLTSNKWWACAFAAFYLFIPSVMDHAVECAEYNLMLCFLTWALYHFIVLLKKPNPKSILCFVGLSTLAFYSQYGSGIAIFGMALTLIARFSASKDWKSLKSLLLWSMVALIVFGIPLFFIFLKNQILSQNFAIVSHAPVFIKKNLFYDFIYSPVWCFTYFFGDKNFGAVMYGITCLAICSALLSRKRLFIWFTAAALLIWTILYFLTVCSLYAFNQWDVPIGFVLAGGRYSLFFTPFLAIVIIMGGYATYKQLKNQKLQKIAIAAFIPLLFLLFVRNIVFFHSQDLRTHFTDLKDAWYEKTDKDLETFMSGWTPYIFLYQVMHDDRYTEDYFANLKFVFIRRPPMDYGIKNLKRSHIYKTDQFYLVLMDSTTRTDSLIMDLNSQGLKDSIIYQHKKVSLRYFNRIPQDSLKP